MASGKTIAVHIRTDYSGAGAAKAKADLGSIGKQASGAGRFVSGLSGALGGVGGAAGKAVSALGNMVSAFVTLGPVGAVIAGLGAAVDLFSSKAKAAAEASLEFAKSLREGVARRAAEVKGEAMGALSDATANATARADAAAKAYNNLAAAVGKVATASAAADRSAGKAKVAALVEDRERAVGAAGSPEEAARVAADYDVRIARAHAEETRRANDADVGAARAEADAAARRLELARQRVAEARATRGRLAEEAAAYRGGPDAELEKASAKALAEAQRKLDDARLQLRTAKADADAARERVAAAESDGEAAMSAARTDVARAERAVRELADAQAKAEAKAAQDAARERDRLDRELHQKRMADLRAEIDEQAKAAAPLRAVASAAQGEFDRAFALYRDPARAEAAVAEERAYAADLDRLHADASRYGGKWRIDELSRLMAAGDTAGQVAALAEWRRSGRFTPEVEAMVRASAAERTKTTAEDELRKIEANTSGLAEKLDELIGMKGGE